MIKRIFPRIRTILETSSAILRVKLLEVALPGFSAGRGARIAKLCRIRTSDGGEIVLGDTVHIDRFSFIIARVGKLMLGINTYVGEGCIISAVDSVTIGRNVLIAEHVTIRDQDHEIEGVRPYRLAGMRSAPIIIGDNVWIGAKVTVTSGVEIGDNSVIGANSVVTRNVPANTLAVGIPARVIRKLVAK